jgi:hypothetical protein
MFNSSGGTREDRNLLAGSGLCSRAASLGHMEALRELGFCLIDRFSLSRSVMNGRRLLLQATAWELHSSGGTLRCSTCTSSNDPGRHACILTQSCLCPRASAVDRGSDRAHRFLCDWFAARNIQRWQLLDNGDSIAPSFCSAPTLGAAEGRLEVRSFARAPHAARIFTVRELVRQRTGSRSTESPAGRWNKWMADVTKTTKMMQRRHLMFE